MKSILFVCVENACRSQVAEAFGKVIFKNVEVISAGLKEVENINPNAVKVMKEIGISMEGQYPKLLTKEMVDKADLVITMGCIDKCPLTPKSKTIDWRLEDPKGKDLDFFRKTRDIIKQRIEELARKIDN
ncbi:MAG: arsenate-mycothiol transferase ArsC [Promethearchaeota archaeon]